MFTKKAPHAGHSHILNETASQGTLVGEGSRFAEFITTSRASRASRVECHEFCPQKRSIGLAVSNHKQNVSEFPLSGTRVLVVEDDSDTREILRFVLEQNGANVVATPAVQPALQAFESVHPDAVVADIGMPDYNGYALIAKIREFDRKRQIHTKCVAVTAYATPTDRDTALNSGYDAYIAKPFRPDELVKTVAALTA